jgi:hypothetical protein
MRMEVFGGTALNARAPLKISQEGEEDLRFTARYETRALEPPFYYGWRVSRWKGSRAWALDFIHHKIHLTDPPPAVERFSISHGFNLLSIVRLWDFTHIHGYAGLGAVIAHPESTVRGRALAENEGMGNAGYYLGGPALTLGGGRSVRILDRLMLSAEMRATLARAKVPVEGGSAWFTHLAAHFLIGAGFRI